MRIEKGSPAWYRLGIEIAAGSDIDIEPGTTGRGDPVLQIDGGQYFVSVAAAEAYNKRIDALNLQDRS